MRKHMLTYAVLSAVFLLLVLSGTGICGERVKAEELQTMLDKKEAVILIDVRTPEEHNEAHIPGSILMPLDTLGSVTKLPEGGRVILYCRSGKRSQTALKILTDKGFKGLTDLEGGILAWKTAGGKVVTGQSR